MAQMLDIVEGLEIGEFGVRQKFKNEMQRYNKFRRLVLGKGKESGEPDAFEIKTYAKYLLTEGTLVEKRELLANLRSRLVFKDKKVTLENNASSNTPGNRPLVRWFERPSGLCAGVTFWLVSN